MLGHMNDEPNNALARQTRAEWVGLPRKSIGDIEKTKEKSRLYFEVVI